jgi:protein disulfide-isomerase
MKQNHRYWDNTMTGNPIVPSRTSILETIPRVLANPPKIPPKSTTSTMGTFYYSLRSTWKRHPWLSIIMLIGFTFSATVLTRRYRRQQWGSGGFFNLDGEKGAFGTASGKVD